MTKISQEAAKKIIGH